MNMGTEHAAARKTVVGALGKETKARLEKHAPWIADWFALRIVEEAVFHAGWLAAPDGVRREMERMRADRISPQGLDFSLVDVVAERLERIAEA